MANSWHNDENKTSISEDDLEDNYYMILNLNKDATEKEITQAYHRLGLVYHPDKHKDADSKRNAEVLFSKVKRAYDVLINAHKRAIYDTLGIKGLEQDGLQLVIRSKTPQEIREEYERISKEREEKRIESLTHSQGSFTMEIDAKNLFDSFSDISEESTGLLRRPNESSMINIGNLSMEQYIDFPMSNNNTTSLGGTIRTNGKFGSGSVTGSVRRILSSDTYLDFKGTLGAQKQLSVSAFKRFGQKLNGSLNGLFRFKNGAVAPVFTGNMSYQLDTHLVGSIQYKTSLGMSSSMSTSVVYEKDNLHLNASFQLSVKNTYISLGASHRFNDNDIKLKTAIQYGYIGATLSYGIEKQITKYSRIDASIIVNSMSGVLLNLGVERGSQQFIIPIHLSQEVVPSAIFYGTVTPLVIYYVAKRLVIGPYLKNKEEKDAKLKQEKLKSELIEKRRIALVAQDLMKETVLRIIDREGPNGLIIHKAIYGKIIDKNNPNFDTEKILDVIVPLQFLVSDHSLQILCDQSKSNLEGFYDPCVGESKSLYIEYKFKNENYQVTFADSEVVRLPKSSHKVEKWWSRSFNNVR